MEIVLFYRFSIFANYWEIYFRFGPKWTNVLEMKIIGVRIARPFGPDMIGSLILHLKINILINI